MKNDLFLYPNVSSLPIEKKEGLTSSEREKDSVAFEKIFENALQKMNPTKESSSLEYVQPPLKFSAHATQRLKDRNITIHPEMFSKVQNAIDLAASKGIEDSLIITPEAAFIVNIKNRTVITALDKMSALGNVFTQIDGAVLV